MAETSLCSRGPRFCGRSQFDADEREGTASPSTSVLHPSVLTFHNPYGFAPCSPRRSRPVLPSSCTADILVVSSPCPFLRVGGCSVLFCLVPSAAPLLPPLPRPWREHTVSPGLTVHSCGFAKCVMQEDRTPFHGQYRKGSSRSYCSVPGLREMFPAIAVVCLALRRVCYVRFTRMDAWTWVT